VENTQNHPYSFINGEKNKGIRERLGKQNWLLRELEK